MAKPIATITGMANSTASGTDHSISVPPNSGPNQSIA